MRVQFTQAGSVQGCGFRRGEERELPDSIALAYIRAGQAVAIATLPALPSENQPAPQTPDRAEGRKPAIRRGGKRVEVATDGRRETR